MDTHIRKGAFVLLVFLVPVSCEVFFTDPVICYFLDAFLMVYCIVATALFLREKFSKMPPVVPLQEEKGPIYQELESPDTDPYQLIETPRRKTHGKKKKAKRNHTQQRDQDVYESLEVSDRPPALPSH